MKTKNSSKSEFDAILRNNYMPFLERAFVELHGEGQFMSNWHLHAIAFQLERLTRGEIRKLVVTIPPRYMKSIAITVGYVAWMLGRDPSLNVVCASYSKDLAEDHAVKSKHLMESPFFRELFPGYASSSQKYTLDNQQTSKLGTRRSISTGGTFTGLGADLLIIDDPISAGDAFSDAKRKTALDWYDNVAASRLNDKKTAKQILVQQRVHEDDLAGHVLAKEGWTHLNLPAIAEEDMTVAVGKDNLHYFNKGDALHPEREPLDILEQTRKDMGSIAFATQYLQAPAPLEGNLVKSNWFKQYNPRKNLPEFTRQEGDVLVHAWDTALSTSDTADYSVCLSILFREGRSHVMDMIREKMTPYELQERMISEFHRRDADVLLVELCPASYTVIDHIQRRRDIRLITDTPKGSKLERLVGVMSFIEAGHVFLPKEVNWKPFFLKELLQFPNAKHDDVVDALTLYLKWVRSIGQNSQPLPPGPNGNPPGSPAQARVTLLPMMPSAGGLGRLIRRTF